MKRFLLIAVAFVCLPSDVCACAKHTKSGEISTLYATKTEAEKAASKFNCTGAHQMGDQWMPCAKQSDTKTHGNWATARVGGSNPAVPLPGARVRDHRTCHDPLLKGKEHQFIKVGTGQRAPFQLDQINILWLSKIRYVADQRNQIGYCFREDSKAHRHLAPCLISSFCSIINLYSNFAGYHF